MRLDARLANFVKTVEASKTFLKSSRPAKAFEEAALIALGRPLVDSERRKCIAALAQTLSKRISPGIPASIIACYPSALGRLMAFLKSGQPYDSDWFSKDLELVLGASLPLGPVTADFKLHGRNALPWAARGVAAYVRLNQQRRFNDAGAYLHSKGWRPWVDIHIDARNLSEFNADGVDDAYRRLALLLLDRPNLAGMRGVSWLYDPSLYAISPHLAWVDRPTRRGAFIVELGTAAEHTKLATLASQKRRSMFDAGLYEPMCCALYWPRANLLEWAANTTSSKGSQKPLEDEFDSNGIDIETHSTEVGS